MDNKREWYICPHCNKRLLVYDIEKAKSEGIYIKCKQCKNEVEIKL